MSNVKKMTLTSVKVKSDLFENLSVAVAQDLSNSGTRHGKNGENGAFKGKIKETARSFIASSVRRSPMIIPVVLEV